MLLLTVDMVGQCLARHWVMPSVHRTSAVGSQPIEIRFARHVGRAHPIDDNVDNVLDLFNHRARLRLCEGSRDASQQGNQEHGGSARGSTVTTLPSFGRMRRYSRHNVERLELYVVNYNWNSLGKLYFTPLLCVEGK